MKGYHSVRISKVKARLTSEDAIKGLISATDLHYNNLADICAAKGAHEHDNHAMLIAYGFVVGIDFTVSSSPESSSTLL